MGWGLGLYDLVKIQVKHPCKGYYLRWYYNGWHYWFFLLGAINLQTEGQEYRSVGTRRVNLSSDQITRTQANAIRTIMNTREVYLLSTDGWVAIRIEPGSLEIFDNQIQGSELTFTAVIGSKNVSYVTGYTPLNVVPPEPVYPLYDYDGNLYTTIIIGNQEWTMQNLKVVHYGNGVPIANLINDAAWTADNTGSYCYYNNDETTFKPVYGALYNWWAIGNVNGLVYFTRNGVQDAGWRIPTEADFIVLQNSIGGALTGGGKLKYTGLTYWESPNTGASNELRFNAVGAGNRAFNGPYLNLKYFNNIWGEGIDATTARGRSMTYDSTLFASGAGYNKNFGFSIRCLRNV